MVTLQDAEVSTLKLPDLADLTERKDLGFPGSAVRSSECRCTLTPAWVGSFMFPAVDSFPAVGARFTFPAHVSPPSRRFAFDGLGERGGGRVALAVVFTGVVPFSAPLVLAGLGLDESAIAPVIALAVYLAWRLRVRLPNQGGCHGLVRRTSTGGEPMLAVGGSPWSPVLSFRALHCRVPQSRPRAMSSNALRVLPDVPGRDIQVLLPAFAPACGTGHEAVKPPFRCRSSWPLACASWITVSK